LPPPPEPDALALARLPPYAADADARAL
jgi:hypothetical protein